MTLTAAERRTLHVMTELAVQWEESLIDANHGNSTDPYYQPDAGMRAVIRSCRRNIAAFRALEAKLKGAS